MWKIWNQASQFTIAANETNSPIELTCPTEGRIENSDVQLLAMVTPPETTAHNLNIYVQCRVFMCDDTNVCRMKETVFKQELNITDGDQVDSACVPQITLDMPL